MLPDQVSNPGPLTYESGALLIALRGPALVDEEDINEMRFRKPRVFKDREGLLLKHRLRKSERTAPR